MKKPNRKIRFMMFGFLTVLLVGCAPAITPALIPSTAAATLVTPSVAPILPTGTLQPATTIPTSIEILSPSAKDVGAVIGVLINKDTDQPLVGLYVQACFLEDTQTSTSNCKRYYGKTLELLYAGRTDENGYFRIDAIPAGEEFFIVYSQADPILGYGAIDSAFQVDALQTLDIGRLEVGAP